MQPSCNPRSLGAPNHVVQVRGGPLASHEVIVDLIGATTTRTGLKVRAELDRGAYPTGVKVSDAELATVPLTRHDWHGGWNYTITSPRTRTTAA